MSIICEFGGLAAFLLIVGGFFLAGYWQMTRRQKREIASLKESNEFLRQRVRELERFEPPRLVK